MSDDGFASVQNAGNSTNSISITSEIRRSRGSTVPSVEGTLASTTMQQMDGQSNMLYRCERCGAEKRLPASHKEQTCPSCLRQKVMHPVMLAKAKRGSHIMLSFECPFCFMIHSHTAGLKLAQCIARNLPSPNRYYVDEQHNDKREEP